MRYVMRHGRRIEVEEHKPDTGPRKQQQTDTSHIGCPVEWLRRVIPIVQSKEQLAVAVWLHRRRAIKRRNPFPVSNKVLQTELGITRYSKYRALRLLEKAQIIATTRKGKEAILVQLL
jgi:hypothetical protein